MRKARIPGTRVDDTAKIPLCGECNDRKHVVRFRKHWVCNIHFKVQNTRASATLELPPGVDLPWNRRPEYSLKELFVNRQHRRQVGHAHS